MKSNLFPLIITSLGSNNYHENFAGILSLQSFLTSFTNLNSIILLYQETINPLIQTCTKLLIYLNQNFSNLAQKIIDVQHNSNSQSTVLANIQELNSEIHQILNKYMIIFIIFYIFLKSLDIVKIWIDLLFKFIQRFNETKTNEKSSLVLISLLSDQTLFDIYQKILSIHLYSNKQIKDCLISTCGIHSIDENINEIKGKVFECWIMKLMTIFYMNFSENSSLKSFFTANINTLLNYSIKSLLSFCINNSGNFQTFMENKKNEVCVLKVLTFINYCITFPDYFETLFQLKSELLFNFEKNQYK